LVSIDRPSGTESLSGTDWYGTGISGCDAVVATERDSTAAVTSGAATIATSAMQATT
jgi:hypothetical protein